MGANLGYFRNAANFKVKAELCRSLVCPWRNRVPCSRERNLNF